MPRRILVLSASVGAGHLRAAEAVELALRRLDPTAVVQNLDVLDFTNAAFRQLYGRAYLDLVNRAPHALGYFYDLLDRVPSPQHKSDRLRLLVEKLNLRRLLKFLRTETWDVIVNTHFLPAEMIAALRRKGDIATPQLTVDHRFRDPSAVGQPAVRPLLHGHRGRGVESAALGRARRRRRRDRHPHPSRLQRAERSGGMPAAARAQPAAGPCCCNWPAGSASGPSKGSFRAFCKSRRRWNWSSSPAETPS